MQQLRLITLPRTNFLAVLACLVVLPVVLLLAVSPALPSLWCQSKLPAYEREFGFTLGAVTVPTREGGTYGRTAIVAIDPKGVFAAAGVRAGDIPRTHHGLADFCGALAAAADGHPVELRVYNVHEARQVWRTVSLRLDAR